MNCRIVFFFFFIFFLRNGFGQNISLIDANDTCDDNFSMYQLDNYRMCFDCHSSIAKKEFFNRLKYVDSIVKSGQIPQNDLLIKYCSSLEQITLIYCKSKNSPDSNAIAAWWCWFLMYSDYLCWDTYNKSLYLKPKDYFSDMGKSVFPPPPQSFFGTVPRRSFIPLY